MNKCDLIWKPAKVWQAYSCFGGIVFLIFFFFVDLKALPAYSGMGYILAFAILVIVPFVLSLIELPYSKTSIEYQYLKWFHLPSAACAILSLVIEKEITSGLLAIPWLIQTLVIAYYGLRLVLHYPKNYLPLICITMGCFYIPIAGSWLIISNLGFTLGFRPTIVFLTAIHFHFAGFALSIIVGITGFYFYQKQNKISPSSILFYERIAWIVIFSPIFVAIGISFSRFIEMVSSIILGVSIIAISMLAFVAIKNVKIYIRILLLLASIAMMGTMSLAGIYGTSQYIQKEIISISQMIITHGILNAFGYTFLSLIAWLLVFHDQQEQHT